MVSWPRMRVVRVLRVNAYESTVGWKGEHPQSVGWLSTVTNKYLCTLCIEMRRMAGMYVL
jgi:hypothetical protein